MSNYAFEFLPYSNHTQMRTVASRYNIIQVGLCFFVPSPDKKSILSYPYNFYVFPRSYKNFNPIVTLQSSTIQFNAKNGMDFNRWIHDGITYMQIDKLRSIAQSDSEHIAKNTLEDVEKKLTPPQKEEYQSFKTKIAEYLKDEEMIQEFKFQVSSTFMRAVIEKYMDKNLPPALYIEPYNCDSPLRDKLLLVIRKITAKDREQLNLAIEVSVSGFTKLFADLWKKPNLKVVGHNSLFDLLYLYQSFVGDLPMDYVKFKQALNQGFPNYYDTKYLAARNAFNGVFENGTSLQQLQKVISGNIKATRQIQLAKGFEKYTISDKMQPSEQGNLLLHEAGYDAYLTGWVFLHLTECLPNWEADHRNKLPVLRSMFSIDLSTPLSDTLVDNSFTLAVTMLKPKEFTPGLFDYKRKKMNELIDHLQSLINSHYQKEDIRWREYKVDVLFVEIRNNEKKELFVKDMHKINAKEEYEVRTIWSYFKEKKSQQPKPGL